MGTLKQPWVREALSHPLGWQIWAEHKDLVIGLADVISHSATICSSNISDVRGGGILANSSCCTCCPGQCVDTGSCVVLGVS